MKQPHYSLKKPGDMVELCQISYPQYRKMLGTLVHRHPPYRTKSANSPTEKWSVLINGRVHPYFIDDTDMSVVV
jgi:hypothetical protein